MDKVSVPNNVWIVCFINSKDKNIKFYSFQDLMKVGNVQEYYFIYQRKNQDQDVRYRTQRIKKIDLFNKEITTCNGKRYQILNDIYVEFRRKRNRKKKLKEVS